MQVKNKLLGRLFNTFDFPIRYAYTQLGIISRAIHKAMFWNLYASNFRGLHNNFLEMTEFIKPHAIDFEHKTVLELGPGNSNLNAFNFLIHNAKNVILLDKFPRIFQNKKQLEFRQQELDFITQQYLNNDFSFYNNDFDTTRFKFIASDLVNTNLTNIDFIYSISVLEHVKNVDLLIQKMYDVLSFGAYMYHKIDLRDHYNFSAPFLFYKYSDKVWNKYLTKEGMSYTNRIRYDEFITMFEKIGFEIVAQETLKYPLPNTKINPYFDHRNNLDVGVLKILLRKK